MKYPRAILSLFQKKLRPNKVVLLIGPRRVGKTVFIKNYLKTLPEGDCLVLNGDDVLDIGLLSERSVANYKRLLEGKSYLIIDEAQHIPDIGMILKLIVDSIDGIKVIASGSSAFDLYHQVGEPLVGRKSTLYLYPLAQMEISKLEDFRTTIINREERLIFGSYPELDQYPNWKDKEEYLKEVMNDYLLKDILIYDNLRNSAKLFSLLKLIAFQIGKEVSLEELGKQLGMSKNTVERYLDLLSKVFVVYKVGGYSKNLRKEISKSSRWYFYDNGIRNAIIQNFNRLDMRMDVGDLWENYLAMERLKYQSYHQINCNNYFWRTYDQQELDWVEEEGDQLRGFEFKYQLNKSIKPPAAWRKAYPEAKFEVIHQDNYLDWIK
ncbi:putative ATPase (AAA+ superfamily) [Belliella baltica DSM 15883]|uniref:Putative ATPase (AAA+ superfamily) n=1 Tax=Belliella baltica (strain DSM 15883 / CIP 108006 / LMG 21964 / BA134) TaxID=866536 RepID=I3Z425_BELBD|nr:ATP-binding protein [Belliella baltica]AFL83993.1 putative ATPase (AAA+ superfamily) [Belliella baltica DSM 15883]